MFIHGVGGNLGCVRRDREVVKPENVNSRGDGKTWRVEIEHPFLVDEFVSRRASVSPRDNLLFR